MILLFGVDGEGNSLLSLDDPVLSKDRGADFTASVTPQPWILAPSGGFGHLRRFTQDLAVSGSASGTITPETDGVPGPAQSFATSASDPAEWVADLDEQGDEGTLTIAITSHVGTVELGDAVAISVPKRSTSS